MTVICVCLMVLAPGRCFPGVFFKKVKAHTKILSQMSVNEAGELILTRFGETFIVEKIRKTGREIDFIPKIRMQKNGRISK